MSETSKQERKKCFKDRRDGYYLKKIDSMHVIMPYVMPGRCCNEAVLSEAIDIENLDNYIKKKNESNPSFKYTWFHAITAAVCKTMLLRPKMNYFITGHRMYERKYVEATFTVKCTFEEGSEEALAKVKLDPDGPAPIQQIHDKVAKFVTAVRYRRETKGITNQFNFFQHTPRLLFRLFVWLLRKMEYYDIYPKALSKDDPFYSSVFLANLGSIKFNANYHHLFEWGTNSFFIVIGEMKERPFFEPDGSYKMRKSIRLNFTIDERIADGFYYAKSIRLLKYLLQHPELLDEAPTTPVNFE